MANLGTKLCVVTGANQGIGLEIARAVGKAPGWRVLATSRDCTKGEEAIRQLKEDGANMSLAVLDIRDQAGVDALAERIRSEEGGQLDALCNNAGVAFKGDTFGAEEARSTFATNLYGTERVTEALLPFLRACAASKGEARIVNVCSVAGKLSQVSPALQTRFQDPSATKESINALVEEFIGSIDDGTYAQKGYPRSMYGMSKLAETAYTFQLAKALAPEGITVTATCPGYCSTNMSSYKGPRTPAKGAETPAWLVLRDGKPQDVAGGLWQDMQLIPW